MQGGEPVIIPNAFGGRLTPSVVHLTASGDAIVGEHALRHRFIDPASTITGIKRLIGRRYNEVMDIARTLPYEVDIGDDNLAVVNVRAQTYTPQVISALILASLKADAEAYLEERVTRAVITVPAYFNEIQRQATMEAARIADLEAMRLINEPTAACMPYGLDKEKDETVAVFDLGGGTFDISILEVGQGVEEVKAVAGDGFLGGDDFDERIAEWIAEEFLVTHGVDVSTDAAAVQRVRVAAVEAKHELSQREEVMISIPFLVHHDHAGIDLHLTFSRAEFRDICEELFERMAAPCAQALADSGLSTNYLARVLAVGGATRMPGIDAVIARAFGRTPSRSVNPDEAVALGAAVQAGIVDGAVKEMLLLDVVSASLGVETSDGTTVTLLSRNTTIPTRKAELFSTMTENQTSIEVHVLQGEGRRAESNRSLGRLVLDGIAPASRGRSQIEITFDIDANGILNATAKDLATNREKRLTVLPDTGVSAASLAQFRRNLPSIRRG